MKNGMVHIPIFNGFIYHRQVVDCNGVVECFVFDVDLKLEWKMWILNEMAKKAKEWEGDEQSDGDDLKSIEKQ